MQVSPAYEKLNLLNEEISQGIKNLSDEPAHQIEASIEDLKAQSYKDRSPEAEFALQLFRKYADVANNIKDNKEKRSDFHSGSIFDSVPSFVFEGNKEEIAGKQSFRKNIFWYRSAVALIGFSAFTVLISTPKIDYKSLSPWDMMENWECPYRYGTSGSWSYGSFNMAPYHAATIVIGVVYSYSIVFCLYYLLPVDDKKHKYIPGVQGLFLWFGFDQNFIDSAKASVGDFCNEHSKTFAVVADSILFVAALAVTISVNRALDQSEKFVLDIRTTTSYPYSEHDTKVTQFYTLGTFYTTLQLTSPPCTNNNPSDNIHAAASIMYLVLIFMALALNISIRSFLVVTTDEGTETTSRSQLPSRQFIIEENDAENPRSFNIISSSSSPIGRAGEEHQDNEEEITL